MMTLSILHVNAINRTSKYRNADDITIHYIGCNNRCCVSKHPVNEITHSLAMWVSISAICASTVDLSLISKTTPSLCAILFIILIVGLRRVE